MNKSILWTFSCLLLLILISAQGSTSLEQRGQIQPVQPRLIASGSPENRGVSQDFGQIPLYFIRNEGQVDSQALYYAKASGYTLWLTKQGLIFDSVREIKKEGSRSPRLGPRDPGIPEASTYERDASRLQFLNSSMDPEVIPLELTDFRVNYFIGNDESKWRTNIQTSKAVLYKEIYQNIDLKVYGVGNQVEYDFIVKPGGDVSEIEYEYRDVERTRIDRDGNLIIKTEFGELTHLRPKCYQVIGEEKVDVEASFRKRAQNVYGFETESYDKNHELIIDPLVIVYSTYLGGFNWVERQYLEEGNSIAVDSKGAAYVTGTTWTSDFPLKNPIQKEYWGFGDVFISKINRLGTALVYSTYLGGLNNDAGHGIAVDTSGAAYVTGPTWSEDFPTKNPIQGYKAGDDDVFITKISPSGQTLVYSTYLGGVNRDMGEGIVVDSAGAVYVTGSTWMKGFPVFNPIQRYNAGKYDIFVTKLSPSGTALVYSTYLGGSLRDYVNSIAVDSEGAVHLAGWTQGDFRLKNPIQSSHGGLEDAFITKINPSGTALAYSTYLGGSDWDWGMTIAVDKDGGAYVGGLTSSPDFPVRIPLQGSHGGGYFDGFVTKINSSGSTLDYSTYLGGSHLDKVYGIAVDEADRVYAVGHTFSSDFPILNPIQGNLGGHQGAMIVRLNSMGTALEYSSCLGGSDYDYFWDIAIDASGAAYVIGMSRSTDFPTVNPIQEDAPGFSISVITKLCSAFTLMVTAGTGGTTSPQPGIYSNVCEGDVQIEAFPEEHYNFSHWSGDVSGTENPIKITMVSNVSAMANFLRIIYAPISFTGRKVENRSLFQAEYINILNWQANPNNTAIQKYRIYQTEGENRNLLNEVSAGTFEQWYRGVEKEKTYRYEICAVNAEGREGRAASITIE